jgi:preprotein translocase subunit YajC|tara:strand:+ start:2895 stop:3104 length:210 start_codon:yes stop_codon:yes gene_type:complete
VSNYDIQTIFQWLIPVAIIMTVVGFILGKRKTDKPILTALSLGISVFVPIVAIVYLIYLLNKPDQATAK